MPTMDFTNRKPLEERNKPPKPTNAGLSELFVGVNKVVIKDNGVNEHKAISNKILLIISQEDKIQKLESLLEIDETNTGFYCMCLGTYAIELCSDAQVKATIGFHHGLSIRYHNWEGDAGLAKSDDLLAFLAEQGFTKPFDDRTKDKKRSEDYQVAEREWLEFAPTCFRKYWTEVNNMDNECFELLIADLNIEIPGKSERIIFLLQTFGNTKNFWTAYPIYENLPNDILKKIDISEIISTYLLSDRNHNTQKGLGRFLCSFEFKKVRGNHLECITFEVIDDLKRCFDNLGEERGINEILSLRNQKSNS
ncbi:hypothetical protein BH11BAC7_BH11BAC7_24380 [soil metagenome]